jgi:hypothetical protein
LGKSPSTLLKMSITSQPSARKMAGAVAPGMPLPLSTTTFIGRASGTLPEDPIPVGVKRELEPDDRIYLGAWTRLVIREATEDEIASLA